MKTLILLILISTNICASIRVIDGDTIKYNGANIRLYGVDAPERAQRCLDKNNIKYNCGLAATNYMKRLVKPHIKCIIKGGDRYKRVICQCFVNGVDIGKEMIKAGHAVAYYDYPDSYKISEQTARRLNVGMFEGQFILPSMYRKGKRL